MNQNDQYQTTGKFWLHNMILQKKLLSLQQRIGSSIGTKLKIKLNTALFLFEEFLDHSDCSNNFQVSFFSVLNRMDLRAQECPWQLLMGLK